VNFLEPGPITGGVSSLEMALQGAFRGGLIFLKKISVQVIKPRGGRSPVSGFASWGWEEGDGVPPGTGGANGRGSERGEIVRFNWHQEQGDPCTPLPPFKETYLTVDILLNFREPIGRPGLLGMTGISGNSQGFKPIRPPQRGE
jgi:hypothetical protein